MPLCYPRNKSAIIVLRTRRWKAFSANQRFLRPVRWITYPGPRGFSWIFPAWESREAANASREAARKKNSPLRESHSPLRGSLTRGKFKKNLWDQGMNHLVWSLLCDTFFCTFGREEMYNCHPKFCYGTHITHGQKVYFLYLFLKYFPLIPRFRLIRIFRVLEYSVYSVF